MKQVDTRGYSCPEPVIMTQRALKETCPIEVFVDNETPKQNISRFAINNGYTIEAREDGEDGYILTISK